MNYSTSLRACLLAAAFATFTARGQEAATRALPSYAEPALSPNGAEIAFVSGGDIWTVPAAGGEARLLVSNPATESRPLYAPDGKRLAFVSTRSGNGDIYVLNMESGTVERLTWDDGLDELSAWSRDGKYLYFSSTSRDIAGMRDVFRVKASGGTPVSVSANRYVNEYFAAPAPDGKSVAFAARGFGSHQWWRKGHSHLDESELWLEHTSSKASYQQLTERGAKQLWPLWSADGKTLYFVSDRNGPQNLWMQPVGGAAKQLTSFTNGRVLWPSMAHNGESIVFERDFAIWKYDVAKGEAKPVSITRRGVPATPVVERARLTSGFTHLALSPDGKKVAFVAHGDVFVAGAKDGGDATRVTNTAANEAQVVWTPNSNTVLYTSEREGVAHIYQYHFITGKETQLTSGRADDAAPLLSPNGKQLAFLRDGRELRVLDLATRRETVVAQGFLGRPPFAPSGSVSWSPDGQWLAYAAFGPKSLRNIMVVPAAGGTSRPISFLANTFGGNVVWSRDGKSILFTTAQRTENGYVARVDLVPRQPRFREDQFRDLFTEPAPPAAKPAAKTSPVIDTLTRNTAPASKGTTVVFEGIRQRLSMLPLGVDAGGIDLSKDGNTLVVVANVAGQTNLYTYSLDELSREPAVVKQLTSTPGSKSNVQLSADGKEVYFLEGGRIQSVSLDSRQVKPLSVTAEMDIDFASEKMEMFRQAWEVQNKGFYDSAFHGVDWQAIRTTYEPLAAGAQTPDELRRILNLMVGELNASHSGVSGPSQPAFTTGRLGLRFDAATYEADGKLKITEVVALSPSALVGGVGVGDYLVAIDGTPVTGDTNIDQLLDNKAGKRVVLSVSSSANGSNARTVVVRPVNQPTEKGLLYKQWVQERRDYVAKASGGRLGYVHMFDMGQGSLDQLYLDMDAENHARNGVVVDVRNNNGGFVNAYALDVLSRKGYMTMTVRGLPPAPARVQLGQRALDAPTILVTNQHSLSDAEDFTEGYRTLGLGKVVGEPTAGWIIYTSAASLIDGSSIRLPFIKITDNRGQNMELAPRPVDIPVTNPLGEEDKDRQLDTAVKELLRQIDAGKQ
jgi:tricorn protease